jgi:hypothetical protein
MLGVTRGPWVSLCRLLRTCITASMRLPTKSSTRYVNIKCLSSRMSLTIQDPFAQNFHPECSEAVPLYTQVRDESKSRLAADNRTEYPQQHLATLRQQRSEFSYYPNPRQSPGFDQAMPLLSSNVHGWMTDGMAASSNAFSFGAQPVSDAKGTMSSSPSAGCPSSLSLYDTPSGSDSFTSIESDLETLNPNSIAIGAVPTNPMTVSFISSIHNVPSGITDFGTTNSGINTLYTNSLATRAILSDPMAFSLTPLAVQGNLDNGKWWDEIGEISNPMTPYDSDYFIDGLPGVRSGLWPTQSEPTSDWPQQTAAREGTISPQLLSLGVPTSSPNPSTSSYASSSGKLLGKSVRSNTSRAVDDLSYPTVRSVMLQPIRIQNSGSENPKSAIQPKASQSTHVNDYTSDIPHPAVRSVSSPEFQALKDSRDMPDPTGRVLRPRRKLSSRPMNAYAPEPSLNARHLRKPEKKRPVPTRSAAHRARTDTSHFCLLRARQTSRKTFNTQESMVSKKIGEEQIRGQTAGNAFPDPTCVAGPSERRKNLEQREAKDDFLVKQRKDGVPYKTIRIQGHFTEAESTLRGRYRAMTKPLDERVRKPEWQGNDVG